MKKKKVKIYYGKAIYGKEEIAAVNKVLKNKSLALMDGSSVKDLEAKIAKIFGKKYGLMVNSGSSANLLALASLNFKKGSEVITPSLTFSTTVSPIYQLGLVPHFVGAKENMFLANIDHIIKCINKKTVAILIPNLLGNIPDWKKISQIAKKYNLKVIEDSADTIGYSYNNGNTGKYSDITTNSFYASHIITGAGFGGIACFNDRKIYEKAKLLRGWGRSSALYNESEDINSRFKSKVDGIPYDSKYIFSDIGYNFLPSEISASFALEQLKKLKKNIKTRISNFKYLRTFFSNYPGAFKLPEENKNVKTGWLAYPIVIKEKSKINRKEMQIYLEKKGIQTRTIFTGNILRQPIMKKRYFKKHKDSNRVSDDVMKNGILIGCHHGLKNEELKFICSTFKEYLSKKNSKYIF
jgi:CDP-4-dehydro-6-deoxyglucose reductase, E1